MNAWIAVLGVLAVVGVGAAVWLAWSRGQLTRRAFEAEAGIVAERGAREAATAERARVEAELAGARARLEDERSRQLEAAAEIARFRAQHEGAEREHAKALQGEVERRERDLLGAQAIHREQLEARDRAVKEIERRTAELNAQRDQQIAKLQETFEKAFRASAAEELKVARDEFLKQFKEAAAGQMKLAEGEIQKRTAEVDRLVKPIEETLRKTDEKLAAIEKERVAAYAGLVKEVQQAAVMNAELRTETGKLVRALSRPEVRGRYGEIQLRRVAELAGMAAYCDFSEQASQRDGEGRLLRPDMIVKLPNDRVVAVDAKTNTDAYLQAAGAETDEERGACLDRFAGHVCDQVAALSKKGYWRELSGSPDFVVMFVPGDQFIDAALARRPELLDKAAEQNVILASPSTLIGLLRAVAVGWREQRLAKEAAALFELGKELHERAAVAMGYATGLGKAINQAVEKYNSFVASMESRLVPTLRRFEEAGVKSGKELGELVEVEVRARGVAMPSLIEDKLAVGEK